MQVAKGLAGVVVADTQISDVRAEGALVYRGHSIESLVERPFYEVANLVVSGELGPQLQQLLKPHVNLRPEQTQWLLGLPADFHPMQMLQSLVPLLADEVELGFGEADPGLIAAAKLPAVVATYLTRQPVHIDPELDYASAFLAALGKPHNDLHAAAFNCAQILQLEHSLNAGTFAARVVASTLASAPAAMAAGIGALSGPLHGGADQAVLDIADGLADVGEARTYVEDALAQGIKVPGMGHREYKSIDPRATCLEGWVTKLAEDPQHAHTYEILRTIDDTFAQAMRSQGKPLHANVEFYKGLVLRVVGLPNQYFTAAFAMARVYGYIAHFIESRQDNRIFRPAARYTGSTPKAA